MNGETLLADFRSFQIIEGLIVSEAVNEEFKGEAVKGLESKVCA